MTAATPMKGIRFLHDIEPELIDYLCKTHDIVMVTFDAFDYEDIVTINNDLTRTMKPERVQKAGMGAQIRSSKDVVQFNNDDMKVLTTKAKKELR